MLKNAPANMRIYWAVIGYTYSWVTFDFLLVRKADEKNRILDRILLKDIAKTYLVSRTLPPAEDTEKNDKIVDMLNNAAKNWPDAMVERADTCRKISLEIKSSGIRDRAPFSAITKLMWFLKPDGWTLFDRYAAAGMNTPLSYNTEDRLMAYYESLEKKDFNKIADKIQNILNKNQWPSIKSERILDMYLMQRHTIYNSRSSDPADKLERLDAFLSSLPECSRSNLHQIAQEAEEALGNKSILEPISKRKGQNRRSYIKS